MLYRFLLGLFLLSCASVQSPPPPPFGLKPDVGVFISQEFTPEERSQIMDGVAMWELATQGAIRWHLAMSDRDCPCVIFAKASSQAPWVRAWESKHKDYLVGYTVHSNPKVGWLVNDRLSVGNLRRAVAAHEFGHMLNLKHVDGKDSLMSEVYIRSMIELTPKDIALVCEKYKCRT